MNKSLVYPGLLLLQHLVSFDILYHCVQEFLVPKHIRIGKFVLYKRQNKILVRILEIYWFREEVTISMQTTVEIKRSYPGFYDIPKIITIGWNQTEVLSSTF